MCATSWDPHRPLEPDVIIKDRPDEKKEDNFEEQVAVARQVYIKSRTLGSMG